MKINLNKIPKSPTIILGFPGMGLVGPIVTEFLIEHMKTVQIGKFVYDELPPTAAIHKGKLIHPMSLHYSKEHNTLILYTILNMHDHEWAVTEAITKLANDCKAKEILVIDGANVLDSDEEQILVYGNKKLQAAGKPLQESVITGVTGSLLLTADNVGCVFAGVQENTPNAKAAVEIVKFLDKYLGLDVDVKPLIKQADVFEEKLTSVIGETKKALDDKEKRRMDYLG